MSQLLDRQFLINNVIDRIEALEHRLRALEAGTIVEIMPDEDPGGVPINLNEGPDIDVVGMRIGRGGDSILVFFSNGDPVAEYTTLADAVSTAATAGDTIVLPSRTIAITAGVTLAAGVALIGMSDKSAISASGFSGTAITLAADAACYGFSLTYVSNGATAIGIDAQFARAIVRDVVVDVSGGAASNVGVLLGFTPSSTLAIHGSSTNVTHTEVSRWICSAGAWPPGPWWKGAGFRLTVDTAYGTGHLVVTVEIESGTVEHVIKLMASNDSANSGVSPDITPYWTGNTTGPGGYPLSGTVTLDGDGILWPGLDCYFVISSRYDDDYTAKVKKIEWHQAFPDVTYTLWDEAVETSAESDLPIVTGCRITATGTAASALKVDADLSGIGIYNRLQADTYDVNVVGTLYIYANQYTHAKVNGTPTYLAGDRAAYAVESWHASDIEASAPTRHVPLPGRGNIIRGGASAWETHLAKTAGFIVQGDGTDVKSAAFDWDTIGAGAGADMVHTHASAGEGGTLDWDNVWADAVHTHASDAEGGQLDWDNVWADAVHDHSAAGEGGKLAQANTHESADTDAATTSLHHTIGAGATQAAAGNHTHALLDPDAIHDNVAGEISAIAEKASPVSADLLIIEDSADANNKKKVQVGNLPSSGGGAASDISTDTTFFDNILTIYDDDVQKALDALDDHTHPGGSAHTIQDEGISLPARTNLNFEGSDVIVSDEPGNNATVVTISTGGGSGDDVLALAYAVAF